MLMDIRLGHLLLLDIKKMHYRFLSIRYYYKATHIAHAQAHTSSAINIIRFTFQQSHKVPN